MTNYTELQKGENYIKSSRNCNYNFLSSLKECRRHYHYHHRSRVGHYHKAYKLDVIRWLPGTRNHVQYFWINQLLNRRMLHFLKLGNKFKRRFFGYSKYFISRLGAWFLHWINYTVWTLTYFERVKTILSGML